VKKRQGVVSQEGDIGVVDQGRKVERVAEESRQEIARTAGQQRKEEELYHIEMEVEREEGAIRNL